VVISLISWNLNHRTAEKVIPDDVLVFFEKYNPDVIALNEFVDGDSRGEFKKTLYELGYTYQFSSPKIGKNNQIFIASKLEAQDGTINSPSFTDAAKTNFLHVYIPAHSLDVIGMRAPFYKLTSEKKHYWEQVSEILSGARDRNILCVGDINYDPFNRNQHDLSEIAFNDNDSYIIKNPLGDWSFISSNGKNTSRIDHVISSSHINLKKVEYLTEYQGLVLAGKKTDQPMSDHAVLSMQLELD